MMTLPADSKAGTRSAKLLPVPVPASQTSAALSRIASATRIAISTCCDRTRYSEILAASGPSRPKTASSRSCISPTGFVDFFTLTQPALRSSRQYNVGASIWTSYRRSVVRSPLQQTLRGLRYLNYALQLPVFQYFDTFWLRFFALEGPVGPCPQPGDGISGAGRRRRSISAWRRIPRERLRLQRAGGARLPPSFWYPAPA